MPHCRRHALGSSGRLRGKRIESEDGAIDWGSCQNQTNEISVPKPQVCQSMTKDGRDSQFAAYARDWPQTLVRPDLCPGPTAWPYTSFSQCFILNSGQHEVGQCNHQEAKPFDSKIHMMLIHTHDGLALLVMANTYMWHRLLFRTRGALQVTPTNSNIGPAILGGTSSSKTGGPCHQPTVLQWILRTDALPRHPYQPCTEWSAQFYAWALQSTWDAWEH